MARAKHATLQSILDTIAGYYPDAQLDVIRKAYAFADKAHAGQLRSSGEPYMIHPADVAQTLAELRLDPSKLKAYNVEPVVRRANGGVAMWLGMARIVGAACRWDPSSGKLKSDVSSLAVVLQDEQGRRYWHRSVELRGEVAETDESGKQITGGQVLQIVDSGAHGVRGNFRRDAQSTGGECGNDHRSQYLSKYWRSTGSALCPCSDRL
jgi:hypothetical protein